MGGIPKVIDDNSSTIFILACSIHIIAQILQLFLYPNRMDLVGMISRSYITNQLRVGCSWGGWG